MNENQQPNLTGLTRSDEHDTSQAAAEKIVPHLSHLQWLVLARFQTIGTVLHGKDGVPYCGVTDSELEKYPEFGEWAPGTARRRRTDLVQLQLVVDSGHRRENAYHNKEIVWHVTPKGLEFKKPLLPANGSGRKRHCQWLTRLKGWDECGAIATHYEPGTGLAYCTEHADILRSSLPSITPIVSNAECSDRIGCGSLTRFVGRPCPSNKSETTT